MSVGPAVVTLELVVVLDSQFRPLFGNNLLNNLDVVVADRLILCPVFGGLAAGRTFTARVGSETEVWVLPPEGKVLFFNFSQQKPLFD